MYRSYYEYIQQVEDRLKRLEEENSTLRKQMERIRPIHIDHIHYKFQELSIQELKGTLNIGMSAITDSEEISKWLRENEEAHNIVMEDIEGSEKHPIEHNQRKPTADSDSDVRVQADTNSNQSNRPHDHLNKNE